jgi:cell division protein FtsB
MYSATRGSSAYKLERTTAPRKQPVRKKRKKSHFGNVLFLLSVFGVMFLISFRFVQIYSIQQDVAVQTALLEDLTMENEQSVIAVNEMMDKSKIAEYATTKLGLHKIESRQIVYLGSHQDNVMEKVAKTEEKGKTKGIFGALTGVMEYLR